VILKSVVAHHEIVDYANENADLVVMSTHGRTGLSRMLLGSTTEQVIQHLKKPQITIKPDLEE
jgi:nucleotide-binding universal stress UspA family protein